MKRIFTIVTLIAATWTSAPLRAQDSNPDRLTINWTDPSKPGLLKVTLMNGGITVRSHTGGDVIIETKSRNRNRRPEPSAVTGLRRIDNPAGLNVSEENNVMSVKNQDFLRSGDIEIQVPAKTSLSLKTMNGGSIAVEGVEGEIEVTNMNGDVTLNNVAGSVVADSMNGRVVVSLREITPNKAMSFTSMNGNVDVTLPATAKANLKMRTDHGGSYSDFEMLMRTNAPPAIQDTRSRGGRYRIETDRSISATINGGGADFDIRTFNGDIFIRKAQ